PDPAEGGAELGALPGDADVGAQCDAETGADAGSTDAGDDRNFDGVQRQHDRVVMLRDGVHRVAGVGSQRLDMLTEVLADTEVLPGRGQGHRSDGRVAAN